MPKLIIPSDKLRSIMEISGDWAAVSFEFKGKIPGVTSNHSYSASVKVGGDRSQDFDTDAISGEVITLYSTVNTYIVLWMPRICAEGGSDLEVYLKGTGKSAFLDDFLKWSAPK